MELLRVGDQHTIDIVVAIVVAYLLALPLGWERKKAGAASIGLRTLPLVSVGACGYVLISRYLYEAEIYEADGIARTLRSLMTGIGFIGGGAILKESSDATGVSGITTGASVWTTGAIGACVAYGFFEVAVALTLTHVVAIDLTGWAGRALRRRRAPRTAS